jgi:hypothetical protein
MGAARLAHFGGFVLATRDFSAPPRTSENSLHRFRMMALRARLVKKPTPICSQFALRAYEDLAQRR